MPLSDFLSDSDKEVFVSSRFTPRRVIRRHCTFTTPPKQKLLVVSSIKAETAFLVINSKIPSFIETKKHLRECQVLIDKASHDFLDHDSYVDCTKTYYEDTPEIFKELVADTGNLKGVVSDSVSNNILEALRNSPTIPIGEIELLMTAISK